ncbi:MAG: hypothetical protein ABSH08_21755 [Tepidisphaeraceae bacterium]|jgi:hypothetical protein
MGRKNCADMLGAAGSNESLGITCPSAHGPHERAKALAHGGSDGDELLHGQTVNRPDIRRIRNLLSGADGPPIHGGFPEAEEFKTI